jgi:hypothetical protein
MEHLRTRRRDQGRDRISRLTRIVAAAAAALALVVSVAAARANPGRFTTARAPAAQTQIRVPAHRAAPTTAKPATTAPATTAPPAVTTTQSPPVIVSGGS